MLACVKIGLFRKEFFTESRILTSESIQKRFLLAIKKSPVNQPIDRNIDLVSTPETGVSDPETPPKQDLSTQRKVKERKVNTESESAREESVEIPEKSFNEKCAAWQKELLEDKEWCASAVRQSGIGADFYAMLPAKMQEFVDFIVSNDEKDSIRSKKDYTRRFHFWWLYHGAKNHSGGGGANTFQLRGKPERKSRVEEIMELGQRSTELALKLYNQAI